jgi:hypothetical protein
MSKWLKTINRINSNRFQVPAGWQTREQVAADLQCDPDRVADLLKPGLQSGDFERQDFPVWDSGRRMTVRVVCYRVADLKKDAKEAKIVEAKPQREVKAPKSSSSSALEEKIIQALQRNPHRDDRLISKTSGAPMALVRRVRDSFTAG